MIGNDWDDKLRIIWDSPGFKKFWNLIKKEYQTKTIYPEFNNIFNALKLTPYKDAKVVIVGQDPYHGEGEAHGLSFSVMDGIKIPPSLQNIYKELHDDLGLNIPKSGNLTKWAKEGVLLLNSALTVIKDTPNSHQKIGWSLFTNYVIKVLNQKETPVVFILWGRNAQEKEALITNPKHLIIKSAHPSPFSANHGFFGSKPFSKTNEFLIKNKIDPINWNL
jgi:uracil-DNA glycosylase